ncbi:multicopper oxidase, putative [Roseovarius sp. 217]|nr:multicopper oxidase, putative [Roseovarius sp. 217]
MDGVAGLTQAAVEPGESFDYDFVVPDAGTYWYHAHARSIEQVARGLYGALIVEEAEAPEVDREEVLILDDWLLDPETAQINPDFTSAHSRSHAGRMGNFVATNGQYGLAIDVRQNERLRLRLINAANARIFVVDIARNGRLDHRVGRDATGATPEARRTPHSRPRPARRSDRRRDCRLR